MAAWRDSSLQSDSRGTVPYRTTGTRRAGGFRKRCASTITKGRGMRTLATVTEAVFSSLTRRGRASAASRERIFRLLGSSYTGPGSSTGVTATRGENGAPRVPVAFPDPLPDGMCGRDYDHRAHDWQTNVAAGSFWFHCPGKSFAWERANREALRSVDESET